MNIILGLQLFLTLLFARSGWHKLTQSQSFHNELDAYRLLPSSFTWPAVYLLAAMEWFCAVGLLFTSLAIVTALALLAAYAVAIAINLLRGKHQIDCGCGGWLTPRHTLAWSLVWRNIILCGLALLCLLWPAPTPTNGITISFGLLIALTLWLLYEAMEQSISNTQHYQTWLQQRTA